MRDHPRERRIQILSVIRKWITESGEGPSIRQIGERGGLSSTRSIAFQLIQLERRGLISRSGRH
ncbi:MULTISPECIES: hypothetical protein [unclassified Streptomyces]|uniref:LexA family protein n=1 Tax=unclassified Streptomyces TaxID=2593676 RepID=UPI002E2B97CE|nr:hypothetical protein [Streptomyces sp. NBC_01429]